MIGVGSTTVSSYCRVAAKNEMTERGLGSPTGWLARYPRLTTGIEIDSRLVTYKYTELSSDCSMFYFIPNVTSDVYPGSSLMVM